LYQPFVNLSEILQSLLFIFEDFVQQPVSFLFCAKKKNVLKSLLFLMLYLRH
jgi:hypothetical protein